MLSSGAGMTAVRVRNEIVHMDCLRESEMTLTMIFLQPQDTPDTICPRCTVPLNERPQP